MAKRVKRRLPGPVDDDDDDDDFIEFLREILKTGNNNWARADHARDVLDIFVHVNGLLTTLKEMDWNRAKGGYRVPLSVYFPGVYYCPIDQFLDYPGIYGGQTFVRNDVYRAANIAHSRWNTYAALFSAASLDHAPKVQAWVMDPDGAHSKFNSMKLVDFRAYLNRKGDEAVVRSCRKKGTAKRRRSETLSESEEKNHDMHKSKKAKGKAKKVVGSFDSDNLDAE